jgi:hypothetical protein
MLKTFVKIKFASRIILFQKTLTYQNANSICYGWQQPLHLQFGIPNCQNWFIVQAIINTLMLVVKQGVLNQSQGYWLLSYAFGSTFSLCTVIKANVCKIQALKLAIHSRGF